MGEYIQKTSTRTADQGNSDLDAAIHLISHDLQAPVRALCTIPEWIEEDLAAAKIALPAQVRDHFEQMNVQGSRLQTMIKDLLTFSRIGRKQSSFRGDWDQLWDFLIATVPQLNDFNCQRHLSGIPQMGCEDIRHLTLALTSNAVKHHDGQSGSIIITAEQQPNHWVLTVIDDGPGIPANAREKAKQIFITLKSRDKVEGSGMGLAIAEKVCQTYGGTLCLEDGPNNVGCKVVVCIPNDGT